MVEITQDLLRKRAEHNEGMLSNLEEITLHQQNIKDIKNFDVYCRHLKILYLQNNLIEEMKGLSKLKELEYLNLAVNSVDKISGIKRCESLNKLDMTLNFVDIEDLEESCDEMAWCENLNDIYFVGNPCTDWEHFREYVIAKCPQVQRFDGEDVTRSERLRAKNMLAEYEAELREIGPNNRAKKEYDRKEGIKAPGYTREERWAQYVEDEEKKADTAKKDKENTMFKDYNDLVEQTTPKGPPEVYDKNGRLRQCNQGKYNFSVDESPDHTKLIFNMEVPKFMATDSLNVDLQPQYVRVDVKGKITQIRFDEEILVERSQVQRSTSTGWLSITMPKADCDVIAGENIRHAAMREDHAARTKLRALEIADEEAREVRIRELQARARGDAARDRRQPDEQAASTENSSAAANDAATPYVHPSDPKFFIEKRPAEEKKAAFIADFDLDEVPDLE